MTKQETERAIVEATHRTDVLIGLDFLVSCRLILDGPARQFSLGF
jgi:hypothetical protein